MTREIAKGKPFTYTEEKIQLGIANAEAQLNEFSDMLTSSDEVLRNAAQSAVPAYESTLRYAQKRTPEQMLIELKKIWCNVNRLETQNVPDEQVEDMLNAQYGDVIYIYRDLLNEGWIESAMQAVTTARVRASF